LPLQQATTNSACFTKCFTDLDPLLLGVDDAGFLVALGFETSVVFVELFRCLSDYGEDPEDDSAAKSGFADRRSM
jgi:hypothetical protein